MRRHMAGSRSRAGAFSFAVAMLLVLALMAGLVFAAPSLLSVRGTGTRTGISGRVPGPRGTFTINSNASYTTTVSVTLNSAVTNATQMRFRDTGGIWTAWQAYATTKAWSLPVGDGTRGVDAEYRDAALRTLSKTDTIILDTTPPTGSLNVNTGAIYTTSTAVNLTLTNVGASLMMVSNSSAFTGASWEAVAGSKAWTLASGDGTKTVYAKFQDAAGNISGSYSDAITLDTQLPTGSIIINGGAMTTSSTAVSLTLSASDLTSGLDKMSISNDGVFDTEPWENYATPKAWTLVSGDGVRTVYVRYRDKAGHVSSIFTDTITLDTGVPNGTVTINSGSAYTTSTAVSLSMTFFNAAEMMISNDPAFAGASWETTAISKAWTLTPGDGTKTVYAKFKSEAGKESTVTSDDIVLDTTPPSGSITIAGGAAATSSTAVTLGIASSGASQMMISNDPAFAGASWETTASSKAWTLPAGDGGKTVYVQFKDAAGNVSTSYSDGIELDTTPPTGSVVVNGDATYTMSTAVSLAVTTGDAAQMMVSNSAAFTGASWEATAATKAWTLTSGDGAKTVYVKLKDALGNVSAAATDDITLDTQAPTGLVSIAGGSVYATSAAVTLSLVAADAVSGVESMRISNDGVFDTESWEDYEVSRPWLLDPVDGLRTVYMQYRDAAGNVTSIISDAVTLDTEAPVGSVTINSGALYTVSTSAQLALSALDPVSGMQSMRISNDGVFDTEVWENYATSKAWTLPGGDGTKTVNVQYRDRAGNISDAVTHSIILDTTAPAGTLAVDGGSAYTTSTAVDLSINPGDAAQMMVSNSSAFTGAVWEATATSRAWILTTGDGTKTVYMKLKDAAGNVSGVISDTIVLDTVAPTGSVSIEAGAAYTTSTAVDLGIASSGASQMMISNDPAFAGASWEAVAASKPWTLGLGDGTKTVYVKLRDAAGNISTVYSDSIVFDETPPAGTLSINAGATYTTSTAVRLTTTATDPVAGMQSMRISNDGVFDTEAWESYAASKSWTLPAGDGGKTVRVLYRDKAGNVSSVVSDDIILDTIAPTGSLSIDGGSTYATSTAVDLGVTSSGAAEMMIANSATFAGAGWETTASPKAWTLASGEGTKTVYMKFKDDAGNISSVVSDSIVLDTNAPAGSVVIAGGSPYATSTTTTLALSAADTVSGVQSMRVSNDGVFDTELWENYATSASWELAAGDWLKTVYVEYRDRAGNISAAQSDTITLDTQAPSGTFAIDDGASQAATVAVSLDSTVSDANPVEMRFRDGGAAWTSWEAYAAHRAWTLAAPDETKTIEAEFRDAAGNELALSDDIRLETGPPEPPGGFLAARGDQQIGLSWSNPAGDFALARVLRSASGYPSGPVPSGDQVIVYQGLDTTATDPGLVNGTEYYYAAFAMDDLGKWSAAALATGVPGEPASMVATGTALSVAYGARVRLSGVLMSRDTTLTARENVDLWRSLDGVAWSRDCTASYDEVTQRYDATSTITARTFFQLRYAGETMYQAAVSNDVTFTCRASVGTPWLVPSRPVRRRSFTVYGYLKPRHAGVTRLYFYRMVRRRWRFFTYRNATNGNYSTYTRFKLTYKLLSAGSWYVKAYHSDADHLPTWGPLRRFTVR